METISSYCMDVYFSSTYTHSQLIIVTSHIMWLMEKEREIAQDSEQRDLYHENKRLCQAALEMTIGRLPFHMPASKETIYAMLLSVSI